MQQADSGAAARDPQQADLSCERSVTKGKSQRGKPIREASRTVQEGFRRASSPERLRSNHRRQDSPRHRHGDHSHHSRHLQADYRSSHRHENPPRHSTRRDRDYRSPVRRISSRHDRDYQSPPRYDSPVRRSSDQPTSRDSRYRSSQEEGKQDHLHQSADPPYPPRLPRTKSGQDDIGGSRSSRAVPAHPPPPMSATSAVSHTDLLPGTAAGLLSMPLPSGSLLDTMPPQHMEQEAVTPSRGHYAMLPDSLAMPAAFSSPPLGMSPWSSTNLPGPPPRLTDPPMLPGPPQRLSPNSGQNSRSALPSPPQAPFDPKDPALDFFSEHFDAMRAIYTRGLQPPEPRVKALDNVVRCRRILPPELPESYSAWTTAHPKAGQSQVKSFAWPRSPSALLCAPQDPYVLMLRAAQLSKQLLCTPTRHAPYYTSIIVAMLYHSMHELCMSKMWYPSSAKALIILIPAVSTLTIYAQMLSPFVHWQHHAM